MSFGFDPESGANVFSYKMLITYVVVSIKIIILNMNGLLQNICHETIKC